MLDERPVNDGNALSKFAARQSDGVGREPKCIWVSKPKSYRGPCKSDVLGKLILGRFGPLVRCQRI